MLHTGHSLTTRGKPGLCPGLEILHCAKGAPLYNLNLDICPPLPGKWYPPLWMKGLFGEAWQTSCQDSAHCLNCALILIQNPILCKDIKRKM